MIKLTLNRMFIKIAIKEDSSERSEYDVIQQMKRKGSSCDVVPLREIPTKVVVHAGDTIEADVQALHDDENDLAAKDMSGYEKVKVIEVKQGTFVVKFISNNGEDVVKEIKQSMTKQKIVRHMYVMQKLDSDLNRFITRSDDVFKISQLDFIIKSVKEQMECLFSVNNEFVYTDLKPANIGVVYQDKKNFVLKRVYLIDLGSVFKDEEGEYATTYPCKNDDDGFIAFSSNKDKKQCMNINLVILMFFILNDYLLKKIKHKDRHILQFTFGRGITVDKLIKRVAYMKTVLETIRKINSKFKFPECMKIINDILKQ